MLQNINILRTEPNDETISKQATKINFLIKEVSQLQEHIKDLEKMNKLNKEALNLLVDKNEYVNKSSFTTDAPNFSEVKMNENKPSVQSESFNIEGLANSNNIYKDFINVLEKILKENKILIEKNSVLIKERNDAQCKVK